MFIVTLYALFGDDIRLALFRKPTDPFFYFMTAISMVLFTVEMTLTLISN